MGTEERMARARRSTWRDWLDIFCQRGILGLVLLILVYAPLATGAILPQDFLVVQGLTILALALWVVRIWAKPNFHLFWPPVCWGVLAFLLYAVVRCQLVEIEYIARWELIRVIVYACLFFLIINNLNRRESATVVSLTLIGLALAISIFAVFQFATHYPMIWQWLKPKGYLTRGSGTFINPNHLAGFLAMILPLAMAYALMGRFSVTLRVIFGYAAFLIMAGIGVSISRGGIIASALILMAFFTVLILNRDFWLRAIILLVIVVIGAIVVGNRMDSAKDRFATAFATGKVEDQRFQYWGAATKIYQKNIWWGAGPGHFDYEFPAYRPPDVQSRPQFVHNDYLNTLCDWGIVGLGLIITVIVLLYTGVVKTWAMLQSSAVETGQLRSNKSAFVLGGSLGLLAIMLHCVVEYNLHMPANALVAVSLIALITAHWRFASEKFWVNPGWFGRACLTIFTIIAIGYLGRQEFRLGLETYWLARAEKETTYSDQKFAALNSAYDIEPKNYETCNALGEFYRVKSWQGELGYQKLAKEAMVWFGRAMDLNPYDQLSPMRYGMCLDWLGEHDDAKHYFDLAKKHDPNGSYIETYVGWHYLQIYDYATAKKCFERALSLRYSEEAAGYLEWVNQKIARQADPLKI